MPSGPKKRRAAQKKKKLEGNNNFNSNNNNNNNSPQISSCDTAVNSHSHGKEDLIRGGEKEAVGGEVSCSATQDHQFNDRDGTGEKQLEISHSESSSIDKKESNALRNGSNEAKKVAIEDGGGTIPVERDLKLEDESTGHNVNVEPVDVGLRRRSSSSSKPTMSEDVVQVATSASHAVGSSEKENEKRESGVIDEKTIAPDVVVDTGLEKRGNRAVETSDTKISVARQDEDKLDLSYDAPDVNGSPDDHQPLVSVVPRPAQTTSWKSCCGLFEVFAGSDK